MISVRRIPKDHTSDLMVKTPKLMASGAVHLIGNLAPVRRKQRKIACGGTASPSAPTDTGKQFPKTEPWVLRLLTASGGCDGTC